MFNLKKSKIIKGLVGCMAIGLVSWLPGTASAGVSGPCSDCHTMHNSQDGSSMAFDSSSTPTRALTKGGCVSCHSGTAPRKGTSNNIPVVFQTGAPSDQGAGYTLAGGDFYWVAGDGGNNDTCGHNVVGVAGVDANLSYTPPGWNATTANGIAGGASTWGTNQLTCAGTYGCHGTHSSSDDYASIRGAHHGDNGTIDGSDVAHSYRFLNGILGAEDSDWEYTASSSDHNGYNGARGYTSSDNDTISYLCAECHGNFHAGTAMSNISYGGSGSSPWLRHPTDFSLADASGSGYTAYTTYSVLAPVGSTNPDTTTSSITGGTNDIVTCISCHRAHGTNQADLLRWDYSACEAGTANSTCGCFACHTNKD